MKELYKRFEEAAAIATAADEAWAADLDNKELEEIADITYQEEWNARNALAAEIARLTGLEIMEAQRLISVKREELAALIARTI